MLGNWSTLTQLKKDWETELEQRPKTLHYPYNFSVAMVTSYDGKSME
jgi:hypothetical protein